MVLRRNVDFRRRAHGRNEGGDTVLQEYENQDEKDKKNGKEVRACHEKEV